MEDISTFDISISSLLWDQIFFYGEFHVIRVAISICKIVENEVFANALNEEEGFEIVSDVANDVEENSGGVNCCYHAQESSSKPNLN